jgi:homoserine O-acetyltransferase
LEDFVRDWEEDHLHGTRTISSLIWTWQHGDIGDNQTIAATSATLCSHRGAGDRHACSSDMYFAPSDNAAEVAHLRRAELHVFSRWGHCVASPGRVPEFQRALDEAAAELLRG